MDEAERSTRVGLISGGRLLKADSPERIKSQFQRQTLEIICSDRSRAFSLLKGALELNPENVQIFGDRLNVLTGCKEHETAWVKNFLLKEGIEIGEARVVPPRLEREAVLTRVH